MLNTSKYTSSKQTQIHTENNTHTPTHKHTQADICKQRIFILNLT